MLSRRQRFRTLGLNLMWRGGTSGGRLTRRRRRRRGLAGVADRTVVAGARSWSRRGEAGPRLHCRLSELSRRGPLPGWLGASGGAAQCRQRECGPSRGRLGEAPGDGTAGAAGRVARLEEWLWPSWSCLWPWACRGAGCWRGTVRGGRSRCTPRLLCCLPTPPAPPWPRTSSGEPTALTSTSA